MDNHKGLSKSQSIIKRVFDIFFALIGLGLFSVIIFIAAILSYFDTGMNGFYAQERIGIYGKKFFIYKIRTMKNISGIKTTITVSNDLRITNLGKLIKSKWKLLAKRNHLDINIMGLDQIPLFIFNSQNNLKYKTFITQEMLKNNILASNVVYVSVSHNKNLLNKYFKILDKIFNTISFCEKNGLDIDALLEQDVCISGIRG